MQPPATEASEGASDTLPYYPATATLQTELKGTARRLFFASLVLDNCSSLAQGTFAFALAHEFY